jgi:hypothetical protein
MWLEGSQKSRFRGLFQAFAVMGWPEKVLFCRWGHAEAKMREYASSTASVAETFVLRPGQGVGLNLLRGGKGLRRHSF